LPGFPVFVAAFVVRRVTQRLGAAFGRAAHGFEKRSGGLPVVPFAVAEKGRKIGPQCHKIVMKSPVRRSVSICAKMWPKRYSIHLRIQ
jgi:hypothetical protein